ncbi:6-phospho-beta-glucosidase [Actinopolymorpha cephalotaxi]|uniref:6-phospho-beta-glucosidase n=1 Tax=Actinopolymorpha cephalotaxi TaxID=504797 RepID=A0A1I2UJ92_9ACTN|nr:glycoside hydrolase [Actinopolymorpha cephalotaxi]NYH86615.1 6-phospho-beta-glucosidase [Actinopolymorpha cephalotaxi]SFG77113.1 6-phospho-beta-glucosidase [Actinopolymorpha cephalotaxi]
MARIKLAYLGGGSTRAAGTMASFVHHGAEFDGSEVVLIDLDADRLALVKQLAERMARNAGLDLTITATTDRREGLRDCDAVLSSFRPGGFEARALDERIPLKHGVIGQETQGPGGFFMALRSIAVMKGVADDLAAVAPNARIFNYTNPVNIVAQAMTSYTDIPIVSLCEGPIIFPRGVAEAAGLDPDLLKTTMVGINHNCWSTEHTYEGKDLIPLLRDAYEARRDDPAVPADTKRLLQLAVTMESVPSYYFLNYYFRDEVLRHLRGKPTTRAEDIVAAVPGYWQHYTEQATSEAPELDPARSRGGIHELELAIDAMNAFYNDTGEVLPVNLPNTGGVLPGFDEEVVVEVPTHVDASGFRALPQKPLPHAVRGLVQALAEHQVLAAKAGWEGDATAGVRALAAHPLVPTLPVAEELYAEMAHAHAAHLPERLLP